MSLALLRTSYLEYMLLAWVLTVFSVMFSAAISRLDLPVRIISRTSCSLAVSGSKALAWYSACVTSPALVYAVRYVWVLRRRTSGD